MRKNILLIVVVVTILVSSILYVVYWGKKTQTKTLTNSELKSVSISEISTHNTKDSCWTVINNKVYDVTKFIPQHKGGERILNACGIDATDLFTGKSPMGRMHSTMAQKILSGMQIGTLQ